MATIEIQGLAHSYGNSPNGLRQIDLQVRDGEFLALLGPSGSGKTTLLRTIAGFLRPDEGRIAIGGREVFGPRAWVPPERRGLGMVFQDHAVWPHLSVAQNIAYPLKRARLPKREATERINAVLDQVGLGEYARRKPAALSGGQRQRVALARAIVASPQALLLDEALSALDEPLRARLRLELRRLTREEGLTAVHVTHDRSEALALADRVVVLDSGRIAQIGTPQQLLREPASAFVASFISDATLFPGTLVGGNFHADHRGIQLPPPVVDPAAPGTFLGDAQQSSARRSRRAVAAVSPGDIELEPAMVASGDGIDSARLALVTSVLRTAQGYETSIAWAGVEVRVMAQGSAPVEGQLVRPRITRSRVFAAAGQGMQEAAA